MSEQHTFASNRANDAYALLSAHEFIELTTFRKNGDAIATPVFFIADKGKLYLTTNGNSGKLKRIRNNGRVLIAPCNNRGKVIGEQFEAHARELPAGEHRSINTLLVRKHGFRFRMFLLVQRWIAFLKKAPRTFVEIELV